MRGLLPEVLPSHFAAVLKTMLACVVRALQSVAGTFTGIVRAMRELADDIRAANVKVTGALGTALLLPAGRQAVAALQACDRLVPGEGCRTAGDRHGVSRLLAWP